MCPTRDKAYLESLVEEVEKNVEGKRVYMSEGEDYQDDATTAEA